MSDTLTCTSCNNAPMVGPPTFEEWLTPEMERWSQDWTQIGSHYFDRDGNVISFAESMWLGTVDPHYRLVKHTHYDGDGLVSTWNTHYSDSGLMSTAHLYFNHGMAGEPILIFETMVFQVDGWEDYQERYTTEAEALVGHEAVVVRIAAGLNPED